VSRAADPSRIDIPDFALVVLIGATGSGKSTFAARHFRPTEIISSDRCRGLVSDDETDQSATADAFDLVRTIAEKPLLLARTEDGSVAALLDRCPHRFAPLSRGRIAGDSLICGYHGIQFDLQGRCIGNPHGPIVSALAVPSFPVVVKHNGVWVWLGDAAKADPNQIADLSLMGNFPPVAQNFGYEPIATDYMLCTDNILDLSHADYLHADSLGGGATTRAKRTLRESGEALVVSWLARNDVAPPALAALMTEHNRPIDLHLEVRWTPPGVMLLNFGLVLSESPDAGGPDTWGIHIMTPRDARNTHYFFWTARNRAWDAESNQIAREVTFRAFIQEDKPMLEAQQASIGAADFDELRPALLRIDEAATRVRRRMKQLIAREQGGEE